MAKKKVADMTPKEQSVRLAYMRIKALFAGLEPDMKKLIDQLLQRAAFLEATLILLEEAINTNGPIDEDGKATGAAGLYDKYIKKYQDLIMVLTTRLMPKPEREPKPPKERPPTAAKAAETDAYEKLIAFRDSE